jgi:putative ABC transport system substrate-binding protein
VIGPDRTRRGVIAFLGATAALGPLAATAQQRDRPRVVAFILSANPLAGMIGPNPTFAPARGFVHGLRDLGWVEGRNIVIERRSVEDQLERGPAVLAEVVARGVDVIVLGAAVSIIQAAQAATTTIPIVGLFSQDDPVAAGLVASLARPGGNLTGVSQAIGHELPAKRFQVLKEVAPQATRLAFLGTKPAWDLYRAGTSPKGISVFFAPIDRSDQFAEAFAAILRNRSDALIVSGGPVIYAGVPRIVAFAAENRLPAMYIFREAVEAGGLMSYGADVPGLFRQMARQVDRILRGARVADLPVEQPTKFELVINLKTAKALGLNVPSTVLVSADDVIE